MNDLKTIDLDAEQFKSDFSEQSRWEKTPPRSKEIRKTIEHSVKEILASLKSHQEQIRFGEVERQMIRVVFALGRLFLAFFLACYLCFYLRCYWFSPAFREAADVLAQRTRISMLG